MTLNFIKSSEKKKLLEELKVIYGISELPYLLIETGKQKLRGFSGHLSKEEIQLLNNTTNIELIGMYLISKKDQDARINFDALPLFKNQINKSTLEINNIQLNLWLHGQDLELKTPRGIVVLKYKEDLVGIGKSNEEKIFNY